MRAAPLLDDSLLKALDKNDGWPLFGGVVDGDGFVESDFFMSLEPGVTAAPKGFGLSKCGLGTVFAVEGDAGEAGAEELLELEENLELILDIHEFRRPGEFEGPAFESFVALGGGCAGVECPPLSILVRVGRWGRGTWWRP